MNIAEFMSDAQLLGPYFQGGSWDRHRAVLKASAGLPLTRRELTLFREVAGDRDPPKKPVREIVEVVGRGGGKDAIASALATWAAMSVDTNRLRPGERGVVLCLATSKDQAEIALSYIRGYFENIPLLNLLVERMREDRVDLKNGVSIIVATNNYRAPRGRTIICAIYDEVAFWKSENTTAPDFETDAAIAPGLARWTGSLKILISSAYRRTGLLYERYKSTFGQNDPDTLCVLGTSREFNETLDAQIIEAELAKDPERASAEYLSIWRDDLSSYIGRDIVEGLIDRGVHERAPQLGTRHVGFVDEAGGGSSGGDASTLSICHIDRDRRVIQDVIRVWKPPFSPAQVIAEKAHLLKAYRIARVTADRWAFGLAADVYRANGIKCEQAPKNKSDLYQDFQALLNSSQIRLLDDERQISELLSLERRQHWGGRSSIDHPVGASYHDDAINATAGAAVMASLGHGGGIIRVSPRAMTWASIPDRGRYWEG